MRAAFKFLLLLLCATSPARAADYFGISDPYMAEYEGFWTSESGAKGRVTAQIRPLANNQYEGFILFNRARTPVTVVTLKPSPEQDGVIKLSGATAAESHGDLLAENEVSCELQNGKLIGTFKGEFGDGKFDAAKSERKSPTLGAKPPKHAVVLAGDAITSAWQNLTWPLSKEGVLRVARGNLLASEELGNFRLHLEFRTPYLPVEQGQARANSGVYLQGKYEVQVLDSFGIYPLKDNDCGGIYKVEAPTGNACLPPMQWQTYDITYVDGTDARPPRITVEHNGIKIIDRASVPAALVEKGTGGGEMKSGFLMLQDHGNPVEFRNIWALPFYSAERAR